MQSAFVKEVIAQNKALSSEGFYFLKKSQVDNTTWLQ
jgi:hypothetical protein